MSGARDFVDPVTGLFPDGYELTPGLNEVYEVRLAHLEAQTLEPEDLLARGAYFASIGGRPTEHFKLCTGSPLEVDRSASLRLRTFFQANQFKTGYATHGLFPYRGKFHPQMIKALVNAMGVAPGDVVVDPMMGSGTVLVEAALMGIDAVGLDTSPLCQLMAQAKLAGLRLVPSQLDEARADPESVYDDIHSGGPGHHSRDASVLLALAYHDATGYAARRKGKSARELFSKVLSRYLGAIEKLHAAEVEVERGHGAALLGDARHLPLGDGTVQGVIFSPPYSFAVDYVENDEDQLRHLEVDIETLRQRMVGLRGRGVAKVETYFDDMRLILSEAARVLEPGRRCCIVVGSNRSQLKRLLKTDDPEGIEDRLVGMGDRVGLPLVWRTTRQVTGIANSMRDEHILLFERDGSPPPAPSGAPSRHRVQEQLVLLT